MPNDLFIATDSPEAFDGGAGNDTVSYENSDEGVNINLLLSLYSGGFAEGDTLTSIENIIGSNFNDNIRGDAGNNIIYGLAGRDVIEGDNGADTIDGGDGWDYARYRGSDFGVTVNLTTNLNTGGDAEGDVLFRIEAVSGSYFDDSITGNHHGNLLRGEIGNDSLFGEGGDDTLTGGIGADFLNGGLGSDTADYNDSAAGVSIILLNNVASGGDAAGDTFSSIENITGSDFADNIRGDNNANILKGLDGRDILEGGQGPDTLDGGEGFDYARYRASKTGVTVNLTTNVNTGGDATGDALFNIEAVTGSYHNDHITGNAGDNYLRGEIGNDSLFGLDGDDSLAGNAGNDILDGGADNDTANYNDSALAVNIDLLNGTAGGGDAAGDTLISIENLVGSNTSTERDYLYGDDGVNELSGLGGKDFLEGGAGADVIDGGDGWDYARYIRSDAGVQINLATGGNTGGHAEGDTLISIEAVVGSSFDDTLTGGTGNDYLKGEGGNDVVSGGAGLDELYGGAGLDGFVFKAGTAFTHVDKVMDLNISDDDYLNIADILSAYDSLTDAITDFVQITDNGVDSFLSIDIDGGADSFVQIATLFSITGLTDEEALETSGNLITV